jgi:hypothetical protein
MTFDIDHVWPDGTNHNGKLFLSWVGVINLAAANLKGRVWTPQSPSGGLIEFGHGGGWFAPYPAFAPFSVVLDSLTDDNGNDVLRARYKGIKIFWELTPVPAKNLFE